MILAKSGYWVAFRGLFFRRTYRSVVLPALISGLVSATQLRMAFLVLLWKVYAHQNGRIAKEKKMSPYVI